MSTPEEKRELSRQSQARWHGRNREKKNALRKAQDAPDPVAARIAVNLAFPTNYVVPPPLRTVEEKRELQRLRDKRRHLDPVRRLRKREQKRAYLQTPAGRAQRRKAEKRRRKTPAGRERTRRRMFKKKYGITLEQRDQMFLDQGESCAICREDAYPKADRKRWHVDHCHQTGRVRGILCWRCNFALGLVSDNPDTLRTMIEYLKDTSPCVSPPTPSPEFDFVRPAKLTRVPAPSAAT